jgi:hypothetical protein
VGAEVMTPHSFYKEFNLDPCILTYGGQSGWVK